MKAIASIVLLLLLQLAAGSCAPSNREGSEPGRTMNGAYVDDSTRHDGQDTITRDINKDWNRVK